MTWTGTSRLTLARAGSASDIYYVSETVSDTHANPVTTAASACRRLKRHWRPISATGARDLDLEELRVQAITATLTQPGPGACWTITVV